MTKITFEDLPSTNTPLNANNLNTLQDNVEDAIDDVAGDIPTVDSSTSTSSTNPVENQAITNYVDGEITTLSGQITGLSTITEGTGTPNSSYVGAVENNKWTRVGKLVCFSFTLTTNNNLDYTSVLFTGLPRAKNDMRFMGLWTNNNYPLRLAITDTGNLQNAWSSSNPSSGQTVEGCVVYITKD